MKALNVFVGGRRAGELSVDQRSGELSFTYDSRYSGPYLSAAMPQVSGVSYVGRKVRTWFAGVLPDNQDVRDGMSKNIGGGRSEFELLARYGMDLPGAVQVTSEQLLDMERPAAYAELSRTQIAERLRSIMEIESQGSPRTWMTAEERWSLAGGQPKIALYRDGDAYSECLGSAASNVILKPGVQGNRFAHQALCECVSMRLAKLCGLRCADVSIEDFDDVQAIAVERFDRLKVPDGGVIRLHQEDMCQAMSVYPDQKYAADGGPNSLGCMGLLRGATDEPDSRKRFFDALVFNHLIAAPDAHGKNYALLHTGRGRYQLAPLFDIASIAPYMIARADMRRGTGTRTQYRTAMSIGGENVIGKLRKSNIYKFARSCALPEEELIERVEELAEIVKSQLVPAIDSLGNAEGIDWLASAFIPRVTAICDTVAHNARATGSNVRYIDIGAIGKLGD